MMDIGLFLVGEKGFSVLESVYDKVNLKFVLSYNDPNTKDDFDLIKSFCGKNQIPFFNGKDASPNEYDSVDKIFVIGWQFILKNTDKLIVIHDSRLPEFKGWSPTVNYLIEGRRYLAATAFSPTEEMDTGNIHLMKTISIKYPMKIKEAIDIVSKLYVDIVIEICETNPTPYEMIGAESFCIWRDYEDYYIDWDQPADKIKRTVDAVGYPFGGAKIKLDGYDLTINECEVVYKRLVDQYSHNISPHTGKLFSINDGKATVICGEYMVKLTDVVDSNGNPYEFKKLKTRLK